MSKFAQNCGFSLPEADTMKAFRCNLACKYRSRVRSYMLNLTLIGKRGQFRSPPNATFANNYGFWLPEAKTMNTFR